MPLSAGRQDVQDAVKKIVDRMPTAIPYVDGEDENEFHAGEAWAEVATAFFKNSADPVWTEAGFSAGEEIFAATMGPSIPADAPPPKDTWFKAAFVAYAACAAIPTNVTPVAPGLAALPPSAVLDLDDMMASPPSNSHEVATNRLFDALEKWAVTGTITQTPPAASTFWK